MIKLDQTTYQNMVQGMLVSDLPRTYQDAITVTRHLKARYLWIDSICILQDERLDIQKEAVRFPLAAGLCFRKAHAFTFCRVVPS